MISHKMFVAVIITPSLCFVGIICHCIVPCQARSHWLGWSGFNLTTFIQLYNIDLVNSATLPTALTIL